LVCARIAGACVGASVQHVLNAVPVTMGVTC